MSLTEHLNKIKPLLLPINIVLLGALIFGLWRYNEIEAAKTPVLIHNPTGTTTAATLRGEAGSEAGTLVGSKNGTKYHYPWCGGAKRIKEENQVWFASAAVARRAGYTPAANCPGLQ